MSLLGNLEYAHSEKHMLEIESVSEAQNCDTKDSLWEMLSEKFHI